jgi:predicted TIM-barrel fold metal-dependent hydrolase
MELFFEEMDLAGISKAVVLGRNSPGVSMGRKFNPAFVPNERLAELQEKYPSRFIAIAGIDCTNTVHNSVKETERCIKSFGFKGIFLEPGRALGTGPDDPRLFPIYEACVELGVSVNIMSGPFTGPDIDMTNPLYIDRVATRYPTLKIISGHGCYPYIQEILGVALKHPNVYVSPDMYIFAPGGNAYVEAANGVLKDQMIFGSAYPLMPLVQTVEDTRKLSFSADALAKYFLTNGAALLKLG